MKYASDAHHRPSTRLKAYDYANAGAYFVTICTQGRECVLDEPVVSGIIADVWQSLPGRFAHLALDEFVVMPNHVHMVVWLQPSGGGVRRVQTGRPPFGRPQLRRDHRSGWIAPTSGQGLDRDWEIPAARIINSTAKLGHVISAFKSLVITVYLDWIHAHQQMRRASFWQRNYYDHIIRNDIELNAIRQYIRDNPTRWELDRDNPENARSLRPAESATDYVTDAANS